MRRVSLATLLLLAACGDNGAERRPGNVSPDDQQGLNDAAAMLDANSVAVGEPGIDRND